MWFIICSQYFPNIKVEEFWEKFNAISNLVDKPVGPFNVEVPKEDHYKKLHYKEESSPFSNQNLWENVEIKNDALRLLASFESEIEKSCKPTLQDSSFKCTIKKTKQIPNSSSEMLLSMRKYIDVKLSDQLQDIDSAQRISVGEKLKLENLIRLMEQDLAQVQKEKFELFEKLKNNVTHEKNLLEKNEPSKIFKMSVDKDLRQASQDEDLFLDYLEYRMQYSMIEENQKNDAILPAQSVGKQPANFQIIQKAEDQVCQICNDGDYTEGNLIVYCSRCSICVHQECYGLEEVPEGNWVCELCKFYGPDGQYMMCAFCPRTGGCMRRTNIRSTSDCWRHVCNIYLDYMRLGKTESNRDADRLYKNGHAFIDDAIKIDSTNYKQYLYYDYFDLLSSEEQKKKLTDHKSPRPFYAWVHLSCLKWIPDPAIIENPFKKSGISTISDCTSIDSCSMQTLTTSSNRNVKGIHASKRTEVSVINSQSSKRENSTLKKSLQASQRVKLSSIKVSIQKLIFMMKKVVESQKPSGILKKANLKLERQCQPAISKNMNQARSHSPLRTEPSKQKSVLELLMSSRTAKKQQDLDDMMTARTVLSNVSELDKSFSKNSSNDNYIASLREDQSASNSKNLPTNNDEGERNLEISQSMKKNSDFIAEEEGDENFRLKLVNSNVCSICGISGYILLRCGSCPLRFHAECARLSHLRCEEGKMYCGRHLGNLIRKKVVIERIREQNEIRKWAGVKKTGREETKFVQNIIVRKDMMISAQELAERLSKVKPIEIMDDHEPIQTQNTENTLTEFFAKAKEERAKNQISCKLEANLKVKTEDANYLPDKIVAEDLNQVNLEKDDETKNDDSINVKIESSRQPDEVIFKTTKLSNPLGQTSTSSEDSIQSESKIKDEESDLHLNAKESLNIISNTIDSGSQVQLQVNESITLLSDTLADISEVTEQMDPIKKISTRKVKTQKRGSVKNEGGVLKKRFSGIVDENEQMASDEHFMQTLNDCLADDPRGKHIWTIKYGKNGQYKSVKYEEPSLPLEPERIDPCDKIWREVGKLVGMTKRKCYMRFRSIIDSKTEQILSSVEKEKVEFTPKKTEEVTKSIDKGETIDNFHEDVQVFCICKQPFEEGRLMVACDTCDEWYHPECIGLGPRKLARINEISFVCKSCKLKSKDKSEHSKDEANLLGKRKPSNKPKNKRAGKLSNNLAPTEEKDVAIDCSFSSNLFKNPEDALIQSAFNKFGSSSRKK